MQDADITGVHDHDQPVHLSILCSPFHSPSLSPHLSLSFSWLGLSSASFLGSQDKEHGPWISDPLASVSPVLEFQEPRTPLHSDGDSTQGFFHVRQMLCQCNLYPVHIPSAQVLVFRYSLLCSLGLCLGCVKVSQWVGYGTHSVWVGRRRKHSLPREPTNTKHDAGKAW